jgi:hypothetical protein
VVVADGVAVTFDPVVPLNPVDGDQEYVDAPLALMLVELPEQMVGLTAFALTAGRLLIVRESVSVDVQPLLSVPVTV